jgi:RecA/RadA recombinase
MLRPVGYGPVTLPAKAAKNLDLARLKVLGQDEVLLTRDAHCQTRADGEHDILIDQPLSENLPFDIMVLFSQHQAMASEIDNEFSVAGAASINRRGARN